MSDSFDAVGFLDDLFAREAIDIQRGSLFDEERAPVAEDFDVDRAEGMMVGLALGDALGLVTEGWLPAKRHQRYGEIRDYVKGRRSREAIGQATDDTQLAFWTLEQLLEDGGFVPEHLAQAFCRSPLRGMGATVGKFRRQFKAGQPWYECGPKSAGNGALMRIAPILLPHLSQGTSRLWSETALCAMLTHNDSASIASCLAFVAMLWELLQHEETPEPMWWLDTFIGILSRVGNR